MAVKWKKPHIPDVRAILKKAGKVAREEAIEGIYAWADEQREAFIVKIEDQFFASFKRIYYPESGTNLSPQWLRRKELAGADLRTMIATGHYVSSIKLWRKGRKARGPYEVRVGFHPRAQARNLDGSIAPVLLTKVARTHEHGSIEANIPPRPHWGPHGNVMRKQAPKARMAISMRIGKRLKKAMPKLAKEAT